MFWPDILHMHHKLYLYDQHFESSTSCLSLFCNCREILGTKTTTSWAWYILVAWFNSQKHSFCLSRGQLFKERGVGAVWTPMDSTALCTTERKKVWIPCHYIKIYLQQISVFYMSNIEVFLNAYIQKMMLTVHNIYSALNCLKCLLHADNYYKKMFEMLLEQQTVKGMQEWQLISS